MKTYPLIDEKKGDRPFAFEIENAYVGTGTIARLLAEVDGVTDVRARKLFRGSSEIHVEFKYLNHDYIVWEPYGDNSRYWIGPKIRRRVRVTSVMSRMPSNATARHSIERLSATF